MEYVREIIDSEKLRGVVNLPHFVKDEPVEIRVLSVLPIKKTLKRKKGSSFGALHRYANPALLPLEKGAWERAAVEKYERKLADELANEYEAD